MPIWHFHPEIELVHINGGAGKRSIGRVMWILIILTVSFNTYWSRFTFPLRFHSSFKRVNKNGKRVDQSENMIFWENDFFNIPENEQRYKLFFRVMLKEGLLFMVKQKRKLEKKIEVLEYQTIFQRLLSNFFKYLKWMANSNEF